MPDTLDFTARAHTIIALVQDHPSLSRQNAELIAEQLRLIWNARGAADFAAIDALDRVDLDTPLAAMLTHSQDAIRGLDR